MKQITIEFGDRSVWEIHLQRVVEHRDKRHPNSDVFFESDPCEILNWIAKEMDWSELNAWMISDPKTPMYSISNGELRVEDE